MSLLYHFSIGIIDIRRLVLRREALKPSFSVAGIRFAHRQPTPWLSGGKTDRKWYKKLFENLRFPGFKSNASGIDRKGRISVLFSRINKEIKPGLFSI